MHQLPTTKNENFDYELLNNNYIDIGKWTRNNSEGVNIAIKDKNYNLIYSGDMTLNDFALCIIGRALSPIVKRKTNRK